MGDVTMGFLRVAMAAALLCFAIVNSEKPKSEQKLIDCYKPGADYFNNVRTPAALLAGASMSAMWTTFGDNAKQFPKLQGLFTILAVASCALMLSVVVMSSFTAVALLNPN